MILHLAVGECLFGLVRMIGRLGMATGDEEEKGHLIVQCSAGKCSLV